METVRIITAGRRLRATGYIIRIGSFGATYSLLADEEGRPRRLHVRADSTEGERALTLTRSEGGPWLAENSQGHVPRPELAEATDVFLEGSAFLASIAIRRSGLHQRAGTVSGTLINVAVPSLVATPMELTASTVEITDTGGAVDYRGPLGTLQLRFDPDGFLVDAAGVQRV